MTKKPTYEELEKKIWEQRYRTILQTAIDGFWVVDAQDGSFLEVNKAYCEMSGYSQQELLTMRISDVEAVESVTDTAAHIQKVMETGENRFESKHRRKDGSIFNVDINVKSHPDLGELIVCFLSDITYRKQTEEVLKLNYELLHIAGETTMFGGWSVDLEKDICTWSDAVADIHDVPHGYAPPVQEAINFYALE